MNIPKNAKDVFISGLMTLGLITGQGLYNNLQAQTLKNNNTIYISFTGKEEINIIQERDRVLQSVNPQLKNEILQLWGQIDKDVIDVYLLELGGIFIFEGLSPQQKASMLLILLDIEKKSTLQQQARTSIEKNKGFCHYMKRSMQLLISKLTKRYNKIIADDKAVIAENEKAIGQQKLILQSLEMMQRKFNEILNK